MRQLWEFVTRFCSTGIVLMAIGAHPVRISSQPVKTLMEMERGGGICPREVCEIRLVIYTDGTITWSRGTQFSYRGQLPEQEQQRLQTLIRRTNFVALQSKPFRGVCPTLYDGTKTVYHFYPVAHPYRLDSCQVAIDLQAPLFQKIETLIQRLEASPTQSPNPSVSPLLPSGATATQTAA